MQFHPRSIAMKTCIFAVWGAYGLTAWTQEPSVKQPERLVPVGMQKQLLVDDFVIAEKHNVSRSLGKVQKHGIVMKPTLPTDFIPPRGQRHDEDSTLR